MASKQLFLALSYDFKNLLNNWNFSDFRILISKVPNTRTFHAHTQILAARSLYFAKALSNDSVKRENNNIILANTNISARIFEVILRILTILELLIAADELILKNLIDYLQDYLIENHTKELEKNFASLHKTSFTHDSFKKLQEFCFQIAATNSTLIFKSQDFTSLNKNDLKMDESEIWKKVVEWGVAKLVDFYNKVKPFGRILPGTLYEDFLHHYLVLGKATISVIKVKETSQLIGGYNPESWHSFHDYLDGKRSFIFSLGDSKPKNAKLSKFIGSHRPFGGLCYEPEFGWYNLHMESNDFQNAPGCYCENNAEYEHAIMPNSENGKVDFFVKKYEVFQIRKL
ncbi:hypothetical protein G9A89_000638 [Geosiphon pyriformis]|nr:hypothetical protein G9A89_000638 [Geosiphon pyriformis]